MGVRPIVFSQGVSEMGYSAETTLTKTVEKSACLITVVGHNWFERLNLRRIKFLVKKTAAIVDMGRVIDADKGGKKVSYIGVGGLGTIRK